MYLFQTNASKTKRFFRSSLNVFFLMRLVLIHYLKNPGTIFTDFIMPIIVMTCLFFIFDSQFTELVLPGILLTPIMSSCFISLAVSYNEWRNSIIFKKIRISRISASNLLFAFLIFYIFVGFASFTFGFFYVFTLSKIGADSLKNFETIIKKVNWGQATLGILQLIIVCVPAGFLISTFSKKPNAILGIGLTLFLLQAFLLGAYVGVERVLASKSMRIFSYTLPFNAPVKIFQHNWFTSTKQLFEQGEMDGDVVEYVKDWKISSWGENNQKIVTSPMNFHNSYWSLSLLNLGWVAIFSTSTIILSKKLKFD